MNDVTKTPCHCCTLDNVGSAVVGARMELCRADCPDCHGTGDVTAKADYRCKADLSRTDVYPGPVIPDADCETALKVLRTMETAFEGAGRLADSEAVADAHRVLSAAVREVMEAEAAEAKGATP